jgi:hypothetical protein
VSAPFTQAIEQQVPGMATAGTDDSTVVGRAPFDGTVSSVTYAPDAAITGANTNTRAVRLRNRGQAGSGTTVIAELQFDSGVNAAVFDEKVITLSATAANLVVADGDILEWFSDAIGTGQLDPGGLVRITIARTYA